MLWGLPLAGPRCGLDLRVRWRRGRTRLPYAPVSFWQCAPFGGGVELEGVTVELTVVPVDDEGLPVQPTHQDLDKPGALLLAAFVTE